MRRSKPEVVIVGSGINSLVCAATLAVRGKSVRVLERSGTLGGCIRTEELFPGFRHDVLSSWYPLFIGSPAHAELGDALQRAGLEFVTSEYTTGVVLPDGRGLALRQGVQDAVRRIDAQAPGDGTAFGAMARQLFERDRELTFGLLGSTPYGRDVMKILYRAWRARGLDGLMAFAADSLESFRRWADRSLRSDLARALIAPWVLHGGLGPDDASSALFGKLTFAAVVANGMPVVRGGSSGIVSALTKVIEAHGGELLTDTHVERVLTTGKRATAVAAGGKIHEASHAVVCNVTPPQLYGQLLPDVPAALRERAMGYRFGRGAMQIHFALRARPAWREPELLHVPLVHLTEGMEQVCMSVVEANNGLLPSRPTLAIGQPTAVDASRAPAGAWILWVQMQELPTHLKGDASDEIPVPADGRWTEAVREAMADRVQARLERVMPGLSTLIVGRSAYSPADLESLNCNLVGGDPYSGACSADQIAWLRPFAGVHGARSHRTPYRNVFHIGASTHPGPGLGGGSGWFVAQRLAPR